MANPYYDPSEMGLETVGEMDLREPDYSFDILLVLRDPETGKFYVISDSGCSCPTPFEDFEDRTDLGAALTAHQAVAEVTGLADQYISDEWISYNPDPLGLIARIMSF